jgi:serine/threonine-protein kinase RsbT
VRAALAAHVRPGVPFTAGRLATILPDIERSLSFFAISDQQKAQCLARLRALASAAGGDRFEELAIRIEDERDLVRARSAAHEACRRIGFSEIALTKLATALSELGRNILRYAGRGEVILRPAPGPRPGVEVVARDDGPGIADVGAVLSPRFRSRTGMGVGLRGTQRIMDHFEVDSSPGRGTRVTIRKFRE